MTLEYMLGVDVGTTGCKATVLREDGTVVGNSFYAHRTSYPKAAWAEQDPENWYEGFKRTISAVLTKLNLREGDIVSIGLDGMMNSPVFLDGRGRILRPAIIWMDQRSAPEAEWLKQNLQASVGFDGPLTPTALLPKIVWVKEHQPRMWKKTYKVLLPKDYIRFRLTGEFATDWSDASATQLFDLHSFSWSDAVCEAAGIDKSKLPVAVASAEVIGRVTRKAAEETGLPQGIPVVAGCSDAAADNLTAGVTKAGQCLIRLGTSGALFLVINKMPLEQAPGYYILVHCVPERWMLHLHTPAGLSKEWFKQTFLGEGHEVTDEFFEALAEKAPVGSQGLVFHPYLMSEHTARTNSKLSGAFIGITRYHTKEFFARAVLEGIAFSLKECLDVLRRVEPSIKSVRGVGGGMKSPLWRSIMADMLGVKVEIPTSQDASFGAGLLGGIGVGLFEGPKDAVNKCVKIGSVVEPNRENHEEYEGIFTIYKEALDRLENLT